MTRKGDAEHKSKEELRVKKIKRKKQIALIQTRVKPRNTKKNEVYPHRVTLSRARHPRADDTNIRNCASSNEKNRVERCHKKGEDGSVATKQAKRVYGKATP